MKVGFSIVATVLFVIWLNTSCQKANPVPPAKGYAASNTSIFTVSINGGTSSVFNGSKVTNGGTTTLIGTQATYTINIAFPNATTKGTYSLNATGFSAWFYKDAIYWICQGTMGTGTFTIDSIVSGTYYGKYNFSGFSYPRYTETFSGSFSNL